MKKKEIFNITFSAILVSLAIVIEILFKFVIVLQMPNGGGVSLSMLPLAIIAVACGWKYGVVSGLVYGIINCFILDGYAFNLASFVLDYLLSFTGIALISIYRKEIIDGKKIYFVIGFIYGILFRWICSGFSGVINAEVWGYNQEYLEGVFGTGKSSIIWLFIYSFIIYNLPYIFVSGALCITIGLLSYKVIFKPEYLNIKEIDNEKVNR